MKAKLKVDDKGQVVLVEGMPVLVYEDGKESPFDFNSAIGKLKELSDVRDEMLNENGKLKKVVEAFGDLDPENAKKAIATLKNIDQKKLVDAGEIENVKAQIGEAFKGQIADLTSSFEKKVKNLEDGVTSKDRTIYDLMVTNRFNQSKFISTKIAENIPMDMVQARFEKHFKVEDGKFVAYDLSGKKIFSRKNPVELADFDEALENIVESHPDKMKLLRGSQASGSGKSPGSSSASSVGNVLILSRVDAQDPAKYRAAKEQAAKAGQTLDIAAT